MDDLPGMQATNLQNLPENYLMKFCRSLLDCIQPNIRSMHQGYIMLQHGLKFLSSQRTTKVVSSATCSRKCTDSSTTGPRCLSSFRHRDDESADKGQVHGHVNSISVLRSYRRLGLAKKLMLLSREQSTVWHRPGC